MMEWVGGGGWVCECGEGWEWWGMVGEIDKIDVHVAGDVQWHNA